MRAAVFALVLLAAMGACRPQARLDPQRVDSTPAGTTEIVGTLDLVFGDPAGGAGSERISASVVEADGKRTPLSITRAQLDSLGPEWRRPGARVRVRGELTGEGGVTVLRITDITLVAAAPR